MDDHEQEIRRNEFETVESVWEGFAPLENEDVIAEIQPSRELRSKLATPSPPVWGSIAIIIFLWWLFPTYYYIWIIALIIPSYVIYGLIQKHSEFWEDEEIYLSNLRLVIKKKTRWDENYGCVVYKFIKIPIKYLDSISGNQETVYVRTKSGELFVGPKFIDGNKFANKANNWLNTHNLSKGQMIKRIEELQDRVQELENKP